MGRAILPITPQLLIEFLGIGKFNVLRTQYNWEKNQIEFVVEHDILPETDPTEYLPAIIPAYQRVGECQVELKEIQLWQNGETIKYEDLEPFRTPEKEAMELANNED